jgi:hypothetical protein
MPTPTILTLIQEFKDKYQHDLVKERADKDVVYGACEDFNPIEEFKKDQANATGPATRID